MKVVELINQINAIGYDENTELTFSCIDGNTGEWYVLPFKQMNYGEELTGDPYHNDVIDLEVDVDAAQDYLKDKIQSTVDGLLEDINIALQKWR